MLAVGEDRRLAERSAPRSLRQLSWNSVFDVPMLWNCFGNASRDKGQSLVPAPPHRMNGNTTRIEYFVYLNSTLTTW